MQTTCVLCMLRGMLLIGLIAVGIVAMAIAVLAFYANATETSTIDEKEAQVVAKETPLERARNILRRHRQIQAERRTEEQDFYTQP